MASTQRKSRTPRTRRGSIVPMTAARRAQTIRWSKVIAAQARISSGHYERNDVRAELAEAVLKELHRASGVSRG